MTKNNMDYKFSNELIDDAKVIREKVFIEEQGFKDEFDDLDNSCWHFVLYEDQPIAVARFYQKDHNYVIGRIAVIKEKRGQHIGECVISLVEEKIKQLGGCRIELSAQKQAQPFYEKLGYQAYGDEYLDEHCPHIKMVKEF